MSQRTTRRTFFKSSATAVVALAVAPAIEDAIASLAPEAAPIAASSVNKGAFISAAEAEMAVGYMNMSSGLAALKEFYQGPLGDHLYEMDYGNPFLTLTSVKRG